MVEISLESIHDTDTVRVKEYGMGLCEVGLKWLVGNTEG